MKSAIVQIGSVVICAVAAALAAIYFGPFAALTSGHGSPASAEKDYLITAVVALVGGLLLAMLVFLLPDRWRRIESEVLSLRQAQDKSLDELKRRADERISDKLDSASRQAQGILDHVSNLSDRFPWIKGISEVGFAPDSNACQIVLRNAARLVATGQGMIAHDYVYSWAGKERDRDSLQGSSDDFLQMAAFARFVFADDYLAAQLIEAGYRSRSRQAFLSPTYLRSLSRSGRISEAIDVAESIRRRALPTWRERLRETWYAARRLGKPTVRKLPPTVDDCTALALFFAIVGDPSEFARASDRAEALRANELDVLTITLAKAEGLAALGNLDEGSRLARSLLGFQAGPNGLGFDLIATLRRCSMERESSDLLLAISTKARQKVQEDFGDESDPAPGLQIIRSQNNETRDNATIICEEARNGENEVALTPERNFAEQVVRDAGPHEQNL
jgi:hypothetical protein